MHNRLEDGPTPEILPLAKSLPNRVMPADLVSGLSDQINLTNEAQEADRIRETLLNYKVSTEIKPQSRVIADMILEKYKETPTPAYIWGIIVELYKEFSPSVNDIIAATKMIRYVGTGSHRSIEMLRDDSVSDNIVTLFDLLQNSFSKLQALETFASSLKPLEEDQFTGGTPIPRKPSWRIHIRSKPPPFSPGVSDELLEAQAELTCGAIFSVMKKYDVATLLSRYVDLYKSDVVRNHALLRGLVKNLIGCISSIQAANMREITDSMPLNSNEQSEYERDDLEFNISNSTPKLFFRVDQQGQTVDFSVYSYDYVRQKDSSVRYDRRLSCTLRMDLTHADTISGIELISQLVHYTMPTNGNGSKKSIVKNERCIYSIFPYSNEIKHQNSDHFRWFSFLTFSYGGYRISTLHPYAFQPKPIRNTTVDN